MSQPHSHHPGIWALSVTAFAIGVAEFIVVGVLPSIAADLRVPLTQAGALVGWYALALAIGTPMIVLALAWLPPKPVLLGLIAVFLAGNLVSAAAHSYQVLLLGRILTALAHGSFFAVGAMVAARLAPEGQASRAIALVLAGLTLAMVIGVPLGSLVGNRIGWRLPFGAVACLAAVGWVATLRWVPSLPAHPAGPARVQLAALARPEILAMMVITTLGFGASFSAFTFITPILTDITGFSIHAAGLLLVVFGSATFAGTLVGGRWASRWGWALTVRRMLVGLLIALTVLTVMLPYRLPVVALLFVWGLLAFGMSPGFQAGMLDTAERWTPLAVSFASALNISAFNLGISMGEAIGSVLVVRHDMALTPLAGAVLALVAQVPLVWLMKRSKLAYMERCPRPSEGPS